MAAITIRKLDDDLKNKLRVRAAEHGVSMEEEAREILRNALERDRRQGRSLGDAIKARFAQLGGVELELPPRLPGPPPISFD